MVELQYYTQNRTSGISPLKEFYAEYVRLYKKINTLSSSYKIITKYERGRRLSAINDFIDMLNILSRNMHLLTEPFGKFLALDTKGLATTHTEI